MFCLTCKWLASIITGLLLLPCLVIAAPPADYHETVTINYDKSAVPAGDTRIAWRVSGGFDPVDRGRWNRNVWLCLSGQDATNGACPTNIEIILGNLPPTSIVLRFTEQRSKATFNVTLTGRVRNFHTPNISGCYTQASTLSRLNVAIWVICLDSKRTVTSERALDLWVTADQLARLPTGGIWKAQLIFNVIQPSPTTTLDTSNLSPVKVATHSFDITLNVTDKYNGAIYLPAFGRATPRVDLNLRTKPLSTAPGGEVSGSTVIDTCLYDGYNSNSPWLKVSLSDLMAPAGRAADLFSVVKTGAANSLAQNRIDYRVTLDYNGQPVKVENGKEITLSGVNRALIRPVVLPGVLHPVICVPAPLTLDVQPFAKASKTAGRYQGTLRINLSADVLAP